MVGGGYGANLNYSGTSDARTGATGSNNVFNIGGNPNLAQFSQTVSQVFATPAAKYAAIAAVVVIVLALVWPRR